MAYSQFEPYGKISTDQAIAEIMVMPLVTVDFLLWLWNLAVMAQILK